MTARAGTAVLSAAMVPIARDERHALSRLGNEAPTLPLGRTQGTNAPAAGLQE